MVVVVLVVVVLLVVVVRVLVVAVFVVVAGQSSSLGLHPVGPLQALPPFNGATRTL